MLVLTRHCGESVVIRDEESRHVCTIRVLRVGDKTVRLGFEAAAHIVILRTELEETDNANDER